jgi:hypothetical protein
MHADRAVVFIGLLPLALAAMVDCGGSISIPAASDSPAAKPTGTASPKASPTASSQPGSGTLTIVVPTPPPVLCVPATVKIAVGQREIVSCTASGYVGPFTIAVANPAIASAAVAAGTYTLLYVSGLEAGTTTLSLNYEPPDGGGALAITVVP